MRDKMKEQEEGEYEGDEEIKDGVEKEEMKEGKEGEELNLVKGGKND